MNDYSSYVIVSVISVGVGWLIGFFMFAQPAEDDEDYSDDEDYGIDELKDWK